MDFVRALAAFVILSAVFLLIERRTWWRRGWRTDLVYWFVTILVTQPFARLAILVPALALVVAGHTSWNELKAGAYHGFGPVSQQPRWLQAVEVYALVDLCGYWSHRWFHTARAWPFHAVHHSSEELDWLASVRVHPLNDFGNKLFQVSPVLLLGFDPLVTLSTAPFFTFYAIFLHARVNVDFGPLRAVIASPVFHRWHHTREATGKNFAGLLPVWDLLFGTYYQPRGRWPEDFGIHQPMPSGFLRQLLWPFSR